MEKYIDVIEFNNGSETVFGYNIDKYGNMKGEIFDIDSGDNYLVKGKGKAKIEEYNAETVERNYDKDMGIYIFKENGYDTIEYTIIPDGFYYNIES